MATQKNPPTPRRGVDGQKVSQGGDRQHQSNRLCPPGCATVCAVGPRWRRALLTDGLADPATRTWWALVGLWGDADLAEVIATAATAYGARTVADALDAASRWPSVVPHDPGRLVVLATAWRHEVEGVSVDG